MNKLHMLVLAGAMLGLSAHASAEVVNLTNSADGANRDAGISAVKQKLQDACKGRKGTPDMASFEVVFERPAPTLTFQSRITWMENSNATCPEHVALTCRRKPGTANESPATAGFFRLALAQCHDRCIAA